MKYRLLNIAKGISLAATTITAVLANAAAKLSNSTDNLTCRLDKAALTVRYAELDAALKAASDKVRFLQDAAQDARADLFVVKRAVAAARDEAWEKHDVAVFYVKGGAKC